MKLKQSLNEATLTQNMIKFGINHNAQLSKLENSAFKMLKRYIKLSETEDEIETLDAVIDEVDIDGFLKNQLMDEFSRKFK
jgi:hypothetical protein